MLYFFILDMLNTNGEQEVPLHESIRMDHCYTNLSGPSLSNAQSAVNIQSTTPQDQKISLQPQQIQILQSQPVQAQSLQSQPMVATVVRSKVILLFDFLSIFYF